MAYNTEVADRLREYLAGIPGIQITEKVMFSGIVFMVNGKMCVNVSRDNLMCRFDPARQEEVAEKRGYIPMLMKGKSLAGYCYVEPSAFRSQKEFAWWVDICLEFNPRAKASKRSR